MAFVCCPFCWYRGFCHRTESDLLLFLFITSRTIWCFVKLNCSRHNLLVSKLRSFETIAHFHRQIRCIWIIRIIFSNSKIDKAQEITYCVAFRIKHSYEDQTLAYHIRCEMKTSKVDDHWILFCRNGNFVVSATNRMCLRFNIWELFSINYMYSFKYLKILQIPKYQHIPYIPAILCYHTQIQCDASLMYLKILFNKHLFKVLPCF